MALTIVVLAAGKGKRMRAGLPKVLHQLAGIPLLEHVVNTARKLNPNRIYVVYGNGGDLVRKEMAHLPVEWVEQKEALGTGHALQQVLPHLNPDDQILVLYGDVPLISHQTLDSLLSNTPRNALGLIVAELENPSGFGRIIRNQTGNIVAIVEEKDASNDQRKIKEINTGILTTTATHLHEWLPRLSNNNAQKEFYLTDIVSMAVQEGFFVGGIMPKDAVEVRGVNNLIELAMLERHYQYQKACELMLEGVIIVDPYRIDVRGDFSAAPGVCIDINAVIEGKVTIGSNTTIGPNVVLRNVQIGENVKIEANSVIDGAYIEEGSSIGPFARIRPGTHIDKNVRVGNFVEIKNSYIGESSKTPHLSYIGDTRIGQHVNIGAGVITVNYDGATKNTTIIKDYAFVGCDSQLIAPVIVGEYAYIAAGSTITQDAPPKQLTVARAKQRSIEGWVPKSKRSSPSSIISDKALDPAIKSQDNK